MISLHWWVGAWWWFSSKLGRLHWWVGETVQVKQESVTIPTPPVQSTTMKYCSSGEKLTSIQCVFVFVLVYLYDCTVWSELFQIVCIPLVRLCFSKVPTPTWASPEITVKCSCVVQAKHQLQSSAANGGIAGGELLHCLSLSQLHLHQWAAQIGATPQQTTCAAAFSSESTSHCRSPLLFVNQTMNCVIMILTLNHEKQMIALKRFTPRSGAAVLDSNFTTVFNCPF